jgi:hypothetical protein
MAGSGGLRDRRNIELILNRRINGFDNYGIPEKLDEKDINGKGL